MTSLRKLLKDLRTPSPLGQMYAAALWGLRKFNAITVLSGIIVMMSPLVAVACKFGGDSTWDRSKTDLIQNAKIIVIAETESVSEDKASEKLNSYDYKFKTVKVLKGQIEEHFTLKGFNNLPKREEEAPVPRGAYGTDCEPQVHFSIGKTYILFPNINNAWSWEEYKGEKDSWFKEIQKTLKSSTK